MDESNTVQLFFTLEIVFLMYIYILLVTSDSLNLAVLQYQMFLSISVLSNIISVLAVVVSRGGSSVLRYFLLT